MAIMTLESLVLRGISVLGGGKVVRLPRHGAGCLASLEAPGYLPISTDIPANPPQVNIEPAADGDHAAASRMVERLAAGAGRSLRFAGTGLSTWLTRLASSTPARGWSSARRRTAA